VKVCNGSFEMLRLIKTFYINLVRNRNSVLLHYRPKQDMKNSSRLGGFSDRS